MIVLGLISMTLLLVGVGGTGTNLFKALSLPDFVFSRLFWSTIGWKYPACFAEGVLLMIAMNNINTVQEAFMTLDPITLFMGIPAMLCVGGLLLFLGYLLVSALVDKTIELATSFRHMMTGTTAPTEKPDD